MKGTNEELGLRGANLWVLPCDERYGFEGPAIQDGDKGLRGDPWEKIGHKDEVDEMLLFMGFPSCKDPSFKDRYPGKATCEIITTAHPEWFEEYLTKEKSQSGKRDNQAYI